MSKPKISGFKKTVLSASVATALGLGFAGQSFADIYEFTFANGGCVVPATPSNTCTGRGDAWFTMLDSGGNVSQNTSSPYYFDPTWGYGLRTQIGGSMSFNTADNVGSISINPFDFFNGGSAIASSITMKKDLNTSSWLVNMNFDWNGNTIVTQAVLDPAGLLFEISSAGPPDLSSVYDAATCLASEACATPASDGLKKGKYPLGPVPVATSTFNTTGQSGTGTVLSDLSLGTDDGVGGSPMDNGPFSGFNANFDFGTLAISGYNDTTSPVTSISAQSVNINVGDAFDVNNPVGDVTVSVTCADNADGSDVLTDSESNNPNLSFTVSGNVDTSTAGTYQVTYTCQDKASRRAAIMDPTDSSGTTVPADNTSNAVTDNSILSVTVVSVGQPVITMLGASTVEHEACTVYTDPGATAVSADNPPVTIQPVVVGDNNAIIGPDNLANVTEGTATITYDISDGGVAATQLTRTVIIADTSEPVITISGGNAVNLESTDASGYQNPDATAVDANGDCSPVNGGVALTTDTVDFTQASGSDSRQSVLKYFATDTAASPNQAQENLTVTVYRSEPVLELNGSAILILSVGDTYTELGMNIRDVQDGTVDDVVSSGTTTGSIITPTIPGVHGSGNIAHSIVIRDSTGAIVPTVDTSQGNNGQTYTITYNATDSAGLEATPLTRTVNVGAYAVGSNFTMLSPAGALNGGAVDVVAIWDGSTNSNEIVQSPDDFNMIISSAGPTPFNGYAWAAHDIRTFGPGTYKFDVTCTLDQLRSGSDCSSNPIDPKAVKEAEKLGVDAETFRFLSITVGEGQVGAHILFDWGNINASSPCGVANCNIDVVQVWDQRKTVGSSTPVWVDPDPTVDSTNKLYKGNSDKGEVGPVDGTSWDMVSTDPDNDGINGVKMVDGPFIGFNANFNFNPAETALFVPPTTSAPDTLLGSGSMSLAGLFSSFLTLLGLGVFRRIKQK